LLSFVQLVPVFQIQLEKKTKLLLFLLLKTIRILKEY